MNHRRGKDGAITSTASQLTLVDLAGSERLSKSEAAGQARKEAQHINKSLSALADVIAARLVASSLPLTHSTILQINAEAGGSDLS